MIENKKVDRRVRYTKKAIRDSFLQLLEEKPIEKISVTEICKGADINRGTFYSHYSDPFELRKSLANELVEAMETRIEELGVTRLTSLQSFELMKENRELFRIFMGPHGDRDTLFQLISKHADEFLDKYFNGIDKLSKQDAKYLRTMIVSSTASIIMRWFDSDLDLEPAAIANILDSYCLHGVEAFIHKL